MWRETVTLAYFVHNGWHTWLAISNIVFATIYAYSDAVIVESYSFYTSQVNGKGFDLRDIFFFNVAWQTASDNIDIHLSHSI